MTTVAQDKDFVRDVVSSTLLEDSITWMQKNLDIETIVGVDALRDYVNGYTDLTDIIPKARLEQWARDHGFKEVEE